MTNNARALKFLGSDISKWHVLRDLFGDTRLRLFADGSLLYRKINGKQDAKTLQKDLSRLPKVGEKKQ